MYTGTVSKATAHVMISDMAQGHVATPYAKCTLLSNLHVIANRKDMS